MEIFPLANDIAQLEPMREEHRAALRAAADDARIWAFTLVDGRGAGFDSWFDEALAPVVRIPFAVRRLSDGAWVGSTSFLDPVPKHKRVEIGNTWYRPDAWGTAVNPACKLLLMTHAFETLGMNRVQYCTDRLNERSQAAIAKLGATREGLLRAHMVTHTGRIRDTVVFSITRTEWPAVKERLLARSAGRE
jgi:RimJ/RimL family protein N-acetyltransferase